MKLLFASLFVYFTVLAAGAPGVRANRDREPLTVHTKQRRWLANDLKAYHQQMRKQHKNYIPSYPDAPVETVISIGTPVTYFWVSLESGSEATFVLAKDYPGRNVSANQPYFDPALSSTAQKAGDYYAFSGNLEVFGTAYGDYIGLFGFGRWKNTTQRFGVVNGIYDPYSINPQMPDGVVGMSWDPHDAANPNENSSAIINLFEEFGWERYYCDYLEVFSDPQYGREYSGETSFGKCLDEICQTATPNNTYPLWWLADTRSLAFWVDSFTYDGQEFAGGYGKVDTGAPNILMPYDSFKAIYDDVHPGYDYEHYLYTVDCSKAGSLPDWVFTIGGNSHAIPSSAYVVDLLLPDNQCALSVFDSDEETTDFVFGYVFHNLWCIKMDIDNQAISILDVLPPSNDEPALN